MNTRAMRLFAALSLLALGALLGFGVSQWLRSDRAATGAAVSSRVASSAETPKRRILYYRHPMGLPDRSAVPKKDAMGMDYIPVYADEPGVAPGTVSVSGERLQTLGVRTAVAATRVMVRTIRAVGTVQADERRDTTIALKFDGWIDRLLVNTTGERVSRGQALMDVYSPELLSAQREYLIARQADALPSGSQGEPAGSNASLATATAERLRNWGIDETILKRLEAGAAPQRTLRITAPVTGVVIEKTAVQGARFMAGEALYRIADLRKVWVIARVFEQDLAAVRVGQTARVRVDAYPAREFGGLVAFIYPTVDPQTRSASARIELDNQDYLLKPAMFVNVEFGAPDSAPAVLAVPQDAVIDTGRSHHVLVQRAAGEFVPREIAIGQRGDGYVEIRSGLEPGEIVVTGANFLIDSESNLRAAFESLDHSAH